MIGVVYIVVELRLFQFLSIKIKGFLVVKVKVDLVKDVLMDNGVVKKGDKKGDKKGVGYVVEQIIVFVDFSIYEVFDQCKGIVLVGKKYVIFYICQVF